MSKAGSNTPITPDEELARFVLFSRWIRNTEPFKTIKPDAFIPHPRPDLSVTRHMNLSGQELWKIGQSIAEVRPATLYGRADIRAADVLQQGLKIESKPVADNPNHANVIGWPAEKSEQKKIALELAANAKFVAQRHEGEDAP